MKNNAQPLTKDQPICEKYPDNCIDCPGVKTVAHCPYHDNKLFFKESRQDFMIRICAVGGLLLISALGA